MPRLLDTEETALAYTLGELVRRVVIANREEWEDITFDRCSFITIGLCFLRVGYLDTYDAGWTMERRYRNLLEGEHFRDVSSVENYLENLYDALATNVLTVPELTRQYNEYIQSTSFALENATEINEANIRTLYKLLVHKRIHLRCLNLYSISDEDTWGLTEYLANAPALGGTAQITTSAVYAAAETPNTGSSSSLAGIERDLLNRLHPDLLGDTPTILRPSSHGQNDEAHNLDIKYRNCWVLAKGVVGKVITFQKDRETRALQIRYLLGNPNTSTVRVKEALEPYDATKHILDFPTLGWVKNDTLCAYLETIPGAYLRGVSENNTHAPVTILKNKVTREGNYQPDISTLIPELAARKFDNISLGLKEKYNNIIISPEACLFLGKSPKGEHEKYFLMIASMCVGEHLKNTPAIKLYKPYKPLKSFIETVINYETK